MGFEIEFRNRTLMNDALQGSSSCSYAYGYSSSPQTDQRWTAIVLDEYVLRCFSPGQLCFGDYDGVCVGWLEPPVQNYP